MRAPDSPSPQSPTPRRGFITLITTVDAWWLRSGRHLADRIVERVFGLLDHVLLKRGR